MRALRLRFMVSRTMGAPHLPEFVREELAVLGGRSMQSISLGEVADTLADSVHPGGFIFEFLRAGQLAVCLGDTLFVHGGVTARNMGFVPALSTRLGVHDVQGEDLSASHSVQAWTERLNAWKDEQWRAFERQPYFNAERTRRGGEGLMAYAHRKALNNRTTMVANFFREDGTEWQGNLQPLDPRVEAYLAASGSHLNHKDKRRRKKKKAWKGHSSD